MIHNGKDAKSTVGVIIEAKKPTNKNEMVTNDNLNKKAFQELILYYLRERITQKNLEIKYLIATNINEWYIFDATTFDRLFAQNKKLVKQFEDFEGGRLADTKTEFFYKQVAEPFIEQLDNSVDFTHFDLREFTPLLRGVGGVSDNKLIALFKLLSPEHLLKLPFANDSNSLDKKFYSELLHIIGLTETKDGGKKVIQRNKAGERNTGSLLENAIIQLDTLDKIHRLEKPSQYGETTVERLFNVGLELSITWVNRILFLKLLEAQLIAYNKAPHLREAGVVSDYSFLNFKKINNYDDLNSLFFQVLAKKHSERNEDVKADFAKVPYLNSSLFEPNELEHNTILISNLRDEKKLPILSNTILKNENGKKRTGELNALEYFFAFLEAYDFSSEGAEDIQEDNKTLINASVLGLIFEKINGYKDGSFFTPGFITMYMCRETIRRSVVQKFNEAAAPLLKDRENSKKDETPLLRGVGGVSGSETENSSKRRTIIPYNPKLKELARKLRNESTKSEIVLWKAVKGKFEGKYDFHRQKPLDNYIADFYCHELKLVIEVDGESHNWEETQKKDFKKESRLNELGLNVLRYTDDEVLNHLNSILDNLRDYIHGFEKGDLKKFKYEDTPLNPLSGSVYYVQELNPISPKDTPLNPLSGGNFKTLDDIYEVIGEDDKSLFTRQEANEIVNSLKICDPAVGSGHFLVSALNEMIAIKNDLKILQDRDGRRLKEYVLEVVNNELVITDDDGELFEYHAPNTPLNPLSRGDLQRESQRLQETLFHEKQTIIENCLFGVDINPNSVKICRLRLWIELLKNAYYKHTPNPSQEGKYGELETLPNIDINIKCGNSLISRFDLDSDIHEALKKSKWSIDSYRIAVDSYRNAQSKEEKHEMERLINDIKSDFRSEITKNDPKLKKLYKFSGELANLTTQTSIFDMSKKEKATWNKKVEKLTKDTRKLETEIEEIKNNKIYENAFEWRFEFPEVLNDEGDFVGFDTVIGNPPYIRQEELKEYKNQFKSVFSTYSGTADIYVFFIERGFSIMKEEGHFTYIMPNKFMQAGYGKPARQFLLANDLVGILDFGDLQVFEEATTYPCILLAKKSEPSDSLLTLPITTLDYPDSFSNYVKLSKGEIKQESLSDETWVISNAADQSILERIVSTAQTLEKFVGEMGKYGIKTGLTEAFVIEGGIAEELIGKNPKYKNHIYPFLLGREVKPYLSAKPAKHLIKFEKGFTNKHGGNNPENWFKNEYPEVLEHFNQFKDKAQKRTDKGDYYWELRACDYYNKFEKPKIMYQVFQVKPCFIYDDIGMFCNNSMWILPTDDKVLLGILNSKMGWWLISKYCTQIQNGYQLIWKYFSQIPIASADNSQSEAITLKVTQILAIKKENPEVGSSTLEAEIDQLVYELYGLTEAEITIVEASVK